MLLYKIEEFNPNYRTEAFDGKEFKGLEPIIQLRKRACNVSNERAGSPRL